MKLLQIPPDVLDQVWGVVAPFLERAAAYSHGTHSVEASRERLRTNHAQLWTVIEDEKPHQIRAAGMTSIVDYPSGARALMIELLSGDDAKLWLPLKPDLEEWAKQNRCTLSYFWGRKGWLRHLPDYELTHYMLKKDLAE